MSSEFIILKEKAVIFDRLTKNRWDKGHDYVEIQAMKIFSIPQILELNEKETLHAHEQINTKKETLLSP